MTARINVLSYVVLLASIFLVLLAMDRLLFLGTRPSGVSIEYNFYTGILPAFATTYIALDVNFYLAYVRRKLRGLDTKVILRAWFLPFAFWPFFILSVIQSLHSNLLIVALGTMLSLLALSVLIPAYLFEREKRVVHEYPKGI